MIILYTEKQPGEKMDNTTQKMFGIAALLLAIIFPVYWLGAFGMVIQEADLFSVRDLTTLSGWDMVLLVIGILEVIVYLGLSQFFRHQLHGRVASVLLLVMAFLVAVFHSTLAVDFLVGLGIVNMSAAIIELVAVGALAVLLLYSVTLLTLGIVLLARFPAWSSLMKVFAVVALITAIAQLSVVLTVLNIILFPILMLIVSFHFLVGENHAEVV